MSTDPRVTLPAFYEWADAELRAGRGVTPQKAWRAGVESMAAEISRLTTSLAEHENTVDRLETEVARLTAELEEARKDAGRYRVLRNRDFDFVVEQDRPGWRTTMPVGRGLDEAIDAAMTKEKPCK